MVNNSSLDLVFNALADPTRRRIVERLSRRSLTVGEIAAEFSISQPAISKHVRVLEESGLLQREIVGRVHHCTLSPAAMESALKWIEKQRAYWNAALDRLDALLASESSNSKRK
jgi:DNA-binding transcriptional ArsR family regulator